jgi:hypothetical protein
MAHYTSKLYELSVGALALTEAALASARESNEDQRQQCRALLVPEPVQNDLVNNVFQVGHVKRLAIKIRNTGQYPTSSIEVRHTADIVPGTTLPDIPSSLKEEVLPGLSPGQQSRLEICTIRPLLAGDMTAINNTGSSTLFAYIELIYNDVGHSQWRSFHGWRWVQLKGWVAEPKYTRLF